VRVEVPTLVLCSTRGLPKPPDSYEPGFQKADIMLKVADLVKEAPKLGPKVKLMLIRDAIHDVFASEQSARDDAFDKTAEFFAYMIG